MAVVDQKALFEVGLPCVGVCSVEELARVGDVGECVITLFLGNGVGKMSGRIYITVENIDDAVACFLAS